MNDPRSRTRLVIGDLEIEAIERVAVRVWNVCGGIVGAALKEPIAVVVRSPAGTRRIDLESLDRSWVADDREDHLAPTT
jgi:hypothetical protein